MILCLNTKEYGNSRIQFYGWTKRQFVPCPEMEITDPKTINHVSFDKDATKILYFTEGKVKLFGWCYTKPKQIKKFFDNITDIVPINNKYEVAIRTRDNRTTIINCQDGSIRDLADGTKPLYLFQENNLILQENSIEDLIVNNGKSVVSNDGVYYATINDNEIKVGEICKGEKIEKRSYKCLFKIDRLFLSPDGTKLLAMNQEMIQYMEFPSLQMIKERNFNRSIFGSGSTIITKGGYIITADYHGKSFVLDSNTLSIVKVLTCPDDYVECPFMAISPDEKYVITATREGVIYIWNLFSGLLIKKEDVYSLLTAVSYSFDGKSILLGIDSGILMSLEWKSFEDLIEEQKTIFSQSNLSLSERELFYL